MAKKKVKKKAGVKKAKEKSGTKEPEGPTEKDLFEMQIDQLKQQLEDCNVKLQQQKEDLQRVRSQLESEVDSEMSCVSYLKRVLKFENDRRLDVQEQLQTLRDQLELVEKRALGKFATAEKYMEAARSQFLQQKLELEGKLSLLEEKRLKRNSQMVHLKKVEEALEQKITALHDKSREEDMKQVAKLLENRDEFLQKCRCIKEEWLEAFQLRLPVHAKKQLEENVRLREMYDRATEKLLQVQDQNRSLKMLEKSLELEEEIQSSAEEDVDKRKVLQEKRLHQLLKARQELKPADVQESQKFFTNEETCFLENSTIARFLEQDDRQQMVATSEDAVKQKTEVVEQILERDNRLQELSTPEIIEKPETETIERILEQDMPTPEDIVKRKIETLLEDETKHCRLLDRWNDVTAVLKDQDNYKSTLEEKLERTADQNGALMSAVLRAGKIFEKRCGRLNQEREIEMDFDLLQQIRFLLDMVSNSV